MEKKFNAPDLCAQTDMKSSVQEPTLIGLHTALKSKVTYMESQITRIAEKLNQIKKFDSNTVPVKTDTPVSTFCDAFTLELSRLTVLIGNLEIIIEELESLA